MLTWKQKGTGHTLGISMVHIPTYLAINISHLSLPWYMAFIEKCTVQII